MDSIAYSPPFLGLLRVESAKMTCCGLDFLSVSHLGPIADFLYRIAGCHRSYFADFDCGSGMKGCSRVEVSKWDRSNRVYSYAYR